jgi:SAM-dependent methyltransferase
MSTASGPAPAPAEVWSAGDYPEVSDRMIPGLGARLVAFAEIRPGSAVLDVAAGAGNASLPAALAGASVTALDITPELIEQGEARSRAAGVEVEWVRGDAQAMPFADESFDHILSCVGVQFCGDRKAAGAELCRVCRPGGGVALVSWTPEGFIGRVLAAITAASGGDPRGPGPLDWGREEKVAELMGRPVADVGFERELVHMPAASAAEWVDFMAAAYGPMVRARSALTERQSWQPLRAELIELADAHGSSRDGGFAVEAEYLLAAIRR